MITLLGGTGYIGQAFAAELEGRGQEFEILSRNKIDYTRFDVLLDYLKSRKPAFLVNAAGFTGKPNVDQCEVARAETLLGNTLFPQTVAHACRATHTPWGHVSSGCIYAGAKVEENGEIRVEKDLMRPEIQRRLRESEADFRILGFTEEHEPNFSFRNPPCSFYSGTKALAEEAILHCGMRIGEWKMEDRRWEFGDGISQMGDGSLEMGDAYIWRLRIPFDEFDNSRNYLSKLQRYSKVYDNVNSISHRRDFVRACLDLWERRAPFGIYNVTNPGFVTSGEVVQMIRKILKPDREFEFWGSDEEFYREAARTPRSNCVLDSGKLLRAGIQMRPVQEALDAALRNWKEEV